MTRGDVPEGYERLELPHAHAIVRARHREPLRGALAGAGATLHDWAGGRADARALQGRGVAWSVGIPGTSDRMVVRHNRHGGLLAPLTGDRFLLPTRAPHELAVALRLAHAGVRTPEVIAYVVYPSSLPGFARSDVATREVPEARDLGAWLVDAALDAASREAALDATARLVGALARAGARHHDLNVKNVLLAREDGALAAWVLDVDRVTFHPPGDARVLDGNVARLLRSARKWREQRGAPVDEAALARLTERARGAASA